MVTETIARKGRRVELVLKTDVLGLAPSLPQFAETIVNLESLIWILSNRYLPPKLADLDKEKEDWLVRFPVLRVHMESPLDIVLGVPHEMIFLGGTSSLGATIMLLMGRAADLRKKFLELPAFKAEQDFRKAQAEYRAACFRMLTADLKQVNLAPFPVRDDGTLNLSRASMESDADKAIRDDIRRTCQALGVIEEVRGTG